MKISFLLKIIILFFSCGVLFYSCSKSDGGGEQITTNAVLQFSVSGIREVLPVAETKMSEKEDAPATIYQHNEHDNYETLSYFAVSDPISSKAKNLLGATKMASGIKYRVELYEINGTTENHWRTLNLEANSSISLGDTVGVVYGKRYKWYAYSYNTNDAITVPAQSQDIPIGNNKDFLHASDEITINQYGNSSINILFQRKTARIAIEIDTRGINADNISNLQVRFPSGIIKSGSIHLKNLNVAFIDLADEYLTLNTSDFVNVDGPYRKVAYIHSSQPISLPGTNSLSFTVPTITYNVTNNLSGAQNSTSRTLTAVPFNFSNVSINIGASGSLKADFLTAGISYGGLTWAPANLYTHDRTSTHRYRFYPHNNQTTDFRTLFSFRGYVPLELATRTATPIDACNLVYPYGRWKTPANSDFSTANMVTSSGLVGNIVDLLLTILLGGDVGNSYVEFDATTPNNRFGYGTQNGLIFPLNGYLPNLSVLNVPTSLDDAQPLLSLSLFQTYTSGGLVYNSGHLWTFDPTVDLSLGSVINVATVGAQHYLALTRNTTNPPRKAVTTTDLLNVSLLNNTLGVISSSFKNVRCIRNPNYNNLIAQPTYNPNIDYDNLPRTYSKQSLIDLGVIL